MIEYLLMLWLAKYREALLPRVEDSAPEPDPLDEHLKIGAGLLFDKPQRKRPDLRIVK